MPPSASLQILRSFQHSFFLDHVLTVKMSPQASPRSAPPPFPKGLLSGVGGLKRAINICIMTDVTNRDWALHFGWPARPGTASVCKRFKQDRERVKTTFPTSMTDDIRRRRSVICARRRDAMWLASLVRVLRASLHRKFEPRMLFTGRKSPPITILCLGEPVLSSSIGREFTPRQCTQSPAGSRRGQGPCTAAINHLRGLEDV